MSDEQIEETMAEEALETEASQNHTKRIAKNTLMLYFRQILIMLVSLYTVRVVLNTLGAEDYGIYNVVAGVVTMFSFISGAMATASQRYFSFALGTGDIEQLKKNFSMSLTIYILFSLIIVIFAETIGLWYINTKLAIPPNRHTAALWIYQASIFSMVCTMLTAPFMASIIAHEDMNIYAIVSIIEVCLKLGIVFLLVLFPVDKLIFYGLLMAIVVFINTAIYRTICKKKYVECTFKLLWDKPLFKELVSYTGWNMFGAAVGVTKTQGVNIILNQYFSPVVVAARSIASQVNSAVNSFSQNFSTAVRPQIIKTYAVGDINSTNELVYKSCKATFFLMYVFTLPLCLEMPYVLSLWLKNPPEYAVIFTQLALIDALLDSISYPLMTAAQATGKIKLYQSVVGGILLLNLPVSLIVMQLGMLPESVFIVGIIITIIAFVVRLMILKQLMKFSIIHYIKKTIIPVFISSVLAMALPIFIKQYLGSNFFSLIITTFLSIVCIGVLVYFIGLSKNERKWIIILVQKKMGNRNA